MTRQIVHTKPHSLQLEWTNCKSRFNLYSNRTIVVKILLNEGVVTLYTVLEGIGPTDVGMHDSQAVHCHDPDIVLDQVV